MLPAIAAAYLVNIAILMWVRATSTNFGGPQAAAEATTAAAAATTALAFVPSVIAIAGCWLLAEPIGEAGQRFTAGGALRLVCVLSAIALCLLVGCRVVWAANASQYQHATWLLKLEPLRNGSQWVLLGLMPVLAAMLLMTVGSVAGATGLSRSARRWAVAGVCIAISLAILSIAVMTAHWLWNRPIRYSMPPGPSGPGTPLPGEAKIYEPERAYFVQALLSAFVGFVGLVVWLGLARIRAQLDRVPKPKAASVSSKAS
jgi:hypothetical protein